ATLGRRTQGGSGELIRPRSGHIFTRSRCWGMGGLGQVNDDSWRNFAASLPSPCSCLLRWARANGDSVWAWMADRARPRLFRGDTDCLPRLASAFLGRGALMGIGALLEGLQADRQAIFVRSAA